VNENANTRRSLDGFFSDSVRRYPERPALYASGRHWSYRDLDAECRSVEAALRGAGLEGRGSNVGVVYARGAFSYAAILAAMRTGNVYVPLNNKLPAARLVKIIEDAGLEAVLIDTSEALPDEVMEALRRSPSLHLIVQDSSAFDMPQHTVWLTSLENARLGEHAEPAPLAYIIYTSGSTGIPKGVSITHESACRCIEKSQRLFGTHELDRFTQFSALSFDVSILDLFLCWKSGATLYVPAQSEAMVPLKFAVTHEITVWSSVPSLANFLLKLQLLKSRALERVRMFLFCGEALPVDLADALLTAAPRSRIFNLYGPTECTIFATCYEYRQQERTEHGIVPIGTPLPGLHCMIVDDNREVKTDDTPGELWLSGDQLAVEYWRNATATQAAFVNFESDDGSRNRWYRTGDLVSRRQNVGYSFRGRLDRQVKLRGFRIELQEIESALRDVIGCALVAVVPIRNHGGICEKIVAYCDALNGDEAAIKTRCLTRIPKYMVPDRIFELEQFPLSESGKINYLALAARTKTAGD
jgi:D-alanine--poly(phosphoribitol) ligase subunit 1